MTKEYNTETTFKSGLVQGLTQAKFIEGRRNSAKTTDILFLLRSNEFVKKINPHSTIGNQ